jgi:hypothetical protein
MPAVSRVQQRYMAGCAHNPSAMHGQCPPHKVAEEFSHKPKGGYPYHKGASPHKGTLYAHKARHGIS